MHQGTWSGAELCPCGNIKLIRELVENRRVGMSFINKGIAYSINTGRHDVALSDRHIHVLIKHIASCSSARSREFLETLLEKGLICLGRRSASTIAAVCRFRECNHSFIVSLIQWFASQKVVEAVFWSCLRAYDIEMTRMLLEKCGKLCVLSKHVEYV